MEILISILCGVFIIITGIISYYKMSKDFKEALENKKESEK